LIVQLYSQLFKNDGAFYTTVKEVFSIGDYFDLEPLRDLAASQLEAYLRTAKDVFLASQRLKPFNPTKGSTADLDAYYPDPEFLERFLAFTADILDCGSAEYRRLQMSCINYICNTRYLTLFDPRIEKHLDTSPSLESAILRSMRSTGLYWCSKGEDFQRILKYPLSPH